MAILTLWYRYVDVFVISIIMILWKNVISLHDLDVFYRLNWILGKTEYVIVIKVSADLMCKTKLDLFMWDRQNLFFSKAREQLCLWLYDLTQCWGAMLSYWMHWLDWTSEPCKGLHQTTGSGGKKMPYTQWNWHLCLSRPCDGTRIEFLDLAVLP